jgi:hypothetical protein
MQYFDFIYRLASLSNAVTPPDNRVEVFVDDKPVLVPPGATVLQVHMINFD